MEARSIAHEFVSIWFHRDVEHLWREHLLPLAPFHSYLEIGCHEGASMLWALEHLVAPDGKAVGIDPYLPKREKNTEEIAAVRARCLRNTYAAREAGRLLLIEKPSEEVLLKLCDEHATGGAVSFDLAYIDGDHWAPNALLDIVLAWRLLTVGGVLVVDDTHRVWRRAKPLVRAAAEAFEHCFETRYRELYRTSRQRGYVKVEP